ATLRDVDATDFAEFKGTDLTIHAAGLTTKLLVVDATNSTFDLNNWNVTSTGGGDSTGGGGTTDTPGHANDVSALPTNQVLFQGDGLTVHIDHARFGSAFFSASHATITAVDSDFGDMWNFAPGTNSTIDVSLSTFNSLTNQATNVTLI